MLPLVVKKGTAQNPPGVICTLLLSFDAAIRSVGGLDLFRSTDLCQVEVVFFYVTVL